MTQYDPLNAEADPFHPPAIPTLVGCLHCGEEYDSYLIEWRVEQDIHGNPHGFWCCPTPNCGGRGFGCDIFPCDPEYRDENGELMWSDDGFDEEDFDEDEFIDDFDKDVQNKPAHDGKDYPGEEAMPF
jgi:hypothetical protein